MKKLRKLQWRAKMLGPTLELVSAQIPRNLKLAATTKADLEGSKLSHVILELLLAYAGDEAKADIERIKTQHRQQMFAEANANLERLRAAGLAIPVLTNEVEK